MAYEHFYQFYDELMDDVPYLKYLNQIKQYAKKTDFILDCGCGSGTLLIKLLKEQYHVVGLDLSDEMLLLASQKLSENQLGTALYQDNILDLKVNEHFNLIYSVLDVINYLKDEDEIKRAFLNIYEALVKDGIFYFDIHSQNKLDRVFDGYSYHEAKDDFAYGWNTYVDKEDEIYHLTHELNFFVKEANGLYRRYEEYHDQVVFPLEFYLECLTNVGFTIENVAFDFDESQSKDDCDKIMITAKKCLL
jgi:SAM-dependent methyltransferase